MSKRVPIQIFPISAEGWKSQKSQKVYCVFELYGGPPRRTRDVVASGYRANFDSQELNFFVSDPAHTSGKVTLMDATREKDGQDTEIGSGSFNIFTRESVASWNEDRVHCLRVPISPAGFVELEMDIGIPSNQLPPEFLPPKSVPRPPPMPVPSGPDPEFLRMQSEFSRLQAENARLQAEFARLQADSQRFQSENARLQAEMARLQGELARLRAENERLANEGGRANAATEEELRRLREENRRLRDEVSRFDDALALRERQVTERLRMEFEIAFEKLRREMEAKAALAVPSAQFELELAEQIRENELLRRQIQELTGQVDSQYDTIAKLRRELELLRTPPAVCTCAPVATCTCHSYLASAPPTYTSVHRPATIIPSYYRTAGTTTTPLVDWVRPDGIVGCQGCNCGTTTTASALPAITTSSVGEPTIRVSDSGITIGDGAAARPMITAARPRTVWRP